MLFETSNNSPFKIGYFDSENLSKTYVGKIINQQKKKLITIRQLNQENIGELENSIIHTRSSQDGKVSKKTIFKQHLKSYEFDIKTNQIIPKNHPSIILNDDILLSVYFDSSVGFKFSFDDFNIDHLDTEYERGLSVFYSNFYDKIIYLLYKGDKNDQEQNDWTVITKFIGNPEALKHST